MNPHLTKGGVFHLRFLLILFASIGFLFSIGYFFYGLQPAAEAEETHEFKISKGEGFKSIASRLSERHFIQSITVFKLYAFLSGRAHRFQPGIYELSPTLNIPQIVSVLTTAGKDEVTVVIPEGSTLKDIDTLLSKARVLPKGSLIDFPASALASRYAFLSRVNSIEGFLFPDTYRFTIDSNAETVLARLLANFEAKAWPHLREVNDWYEVLILASYVEREVQTFEDRQLVAGILRKRLKLNMALQVDATLSYAKCGGELIGCGVKVIARGDVDLASRYNTYRKKGWTPTPIANPGENAIRAALTPKTSPYLYYLSVAKTRETLFSKTLEEHNIKRAKYL